VLSSPWAEIYLLLRILMEKLDLLFPAIISILEE
jgi:hypothetical protein